MTRLASGVPIAMDTTPPGRARHRGRELSATASAWGFLVRKFPCLNGQRGLGKPGDDR
jgi:hypothetical protein